MYLAKINSCLAHTCYLTKLYYTTEIIHNLQQGLIRVFTCYTGVPEARPILCCMVYYGFSVMSQRGRGAHKGKVSQYYVFMLAKADEAMFIPMNK